MDNDIERIISILHEEERLFTEIHGIEERKIGAIMSHDGSLLERLSRRQETILEEIEKVEKSRCDCISDFAALHNISGRHTLSDIAARVDANTAERLVEAGQRLRLQLEGLKKIQATVRTLIDDNMEYYRILIAGLKRAPGSSAQYGNNGREEEKGRRSILINTTA